MASPYSARNSTTGSTRSSSVNLPPPASPFDDPGWRSPAPLSTASLSSPSSLHPASARPFSLQQHDPPTRHTSSSHQSRRISAASSLLSASTASTSASTRLGSGGGHLTPTRTATTATTATGNSARYPVPMPLPLPGHQQGPRSPAGSGLGSAAGARSPTASSTTAGTDIPWSPSQPPQQQQESSIGSEDYRASVEREFAARHGELQARARSLLAEMQVLQGSGQGAEDDSEDDKAAIAALQGLLAGRLGGGSNSGTTNNNNGGGDDDDSSSDSKALRAARAVAREVAALSSPLFSFAEDSKAQIGRDAAVQAVLIADLDAALAWARASSPQARQGAPKEPVSSLRQCVLDRAELLAAALPAALTDACGNAVMHFEHETLFPLASSLVSSVSGVGSVGDAGNGGAGDEWEDWDEAEDDEEEDYTAQQQRRKRRQQPRKWWQYANALTFRGEAPVASIPRERFLASEDGFAWDMAELVAQLEADAEVSSADDNGNGESDDDGVTMRNPVTGVPFSVLDARRILAHPLGRALAAPLPDDDGDDKHNDDNDDSDKGAPVAVRSGPSPVTALPSLVSRRGADSNNGMVRLSAPGAFPEPAEDEQQSAEDHLKWKPDSDWETEAEADDEPGTGLASYEPSEMGDSVFG
ncbi:hypothetical protein B0T24DRAFT_627237 [Lasiosphaeria ovina]|uniref:Uncharacterized protein n=1 Tax=Lasiosphaeria ovina TaxID=92902 RepID=A0AAE0K687_9PEZI|nr:hypothetical protein B0T24DRAFT_627237 [Lasiosphaeria ovina]